MDPETIRRAQQIAQEGGLLGPDDVEEQYPATEAASAMAKRVFARIQPGYGKPTTRHPIVAAGAGLVGGRGSAFADAIEASGVERGPLHEYQPEGFAAEVGYNVGNLVGRLPYYAGAGRLVGGGSRAAGGYLASRGVNPAVARTAQRMVSGAGTFGLGDVASETVAQGVEALPWTGEGSESFRPGEIARAGAHGAAIGSVLGPVQAIRSYPKRFLAEVAGLTGVGSAIQGRMPTLEDGLHNAALIGVLHSAKLLKGPKGEPRAPGGDDPGQAAGVLKSMIAGFRSGRTVETAREGDPHMQAALLDGLEKAQSGDPQYLALFWEFMPPELRQRHIEALENQSNVERAAQEMGEGRLEGDPEVRNNLDLAEQNLRAIEAEVAEQVDNFRREYRGALDSQARQQGRPTQGSTARRAQLTAERERLSEEFSQTDPSYGSGLMGALDSKTRMEAIDRELAGLDRQDTTAVPRQEPNRARGRVLDPEPLEAEYRALDAELRGNPTERQATEIVERMREIGDELGEIGLDVPRDRLEGGGSRPFQERAGDREQPGFAPGQVISGLGDRTVPGYRTPLERPVTQSPMIVDEFGRSMPTGQTEPTLAGRNVSRQQQRLAAAAAEILGRLAPMQEGPSILGGDGSRPTEVRRQPTPPPSRTLAQTRRNRVAAREAADQPPRPPAPTRQLPPGPPTRRRLPPSSGKAGKTRENGKEWARQLEAGEITNEGGPGRRAARTFAGRAGLKGAELQAAIEAGEQLGWSQKHIRKMDAATLAEVVRTNTTPWNKPALFRKLGGRGDPKPPGGRGAAPPKPPPPGEPPAGPPPGGPPPSAPPSVPPPKRKPGRIVMPPISTPPKPKPPESGYSRTPPTKPGESERASLELSQRAVGADLLAKKRLDEAAKDVEPDPTPAQAEAGNYKKGHARWQGMDVSIETAKGGTRKGPGWEVKNFPAHYGDLKGTEGKDGDAIDVFVGPKPESGKVWVIDQRNLSTGKFDEHKGLIGFESREKALDAYRRAYEKGMSEKLIGSVSEVSVERFKKWATSGTRKARPFSAQFKASKGDPAKAEPPAKAKPTEPLMAGQQVKVGRAERYIQDVRVKNGKVEYKIGGTRARAPRTGLHWVPESQVKPLGVIKAQTTTKKAAPKPQYPDSEVDAMARWIADNGGINFGEESLTANESYKTVPPLHRKGGRSKDGLADLLKEGWGEKWHTQKMARDWIEDVLLGGGGKNAAKSFGWTRAEDVIKEIEGKHGKFTADALRDEMSEIQNYVPRFDAERYALDAEKELRAGTRQAADADPNEDMFALLRAGTKKKPVELKPPEPDAVAARDAAWQEYKRLSAKADTIGEHTSKAIRGSDLKSKEGKAAIDAALARKAEAVKQSNIAHDRYAELEKKAPTEDERPSMEEAAASIEAARRGREQAESDNLKVERARDRDEGRGQDRMFDPELDRRKADEAEIQEKVAEEESRQTSLIPDATKKHITSNMERTAPGPKPSKRDLLEDAERNEKPDGPDDSFDPNSGSLGAASARDFRKPSMSVRDVKNAANEYGVQYPVPGKPAAMTPDRMKQAEAQLAQAERTFGKKATENFRDYLEKSRKLGAQEESRQQGLERQRTGKATIGDMKATAVKIPKEGRAPSDAERSILARDGEWSPKDAAQLGRSATIESREQFDKLPAGQKLVHLVRRIRAAGHPKEIDAIMAAEKYGVSDLAREDLQALGTAIGERARGIRELESAPEDAKGGASGQGLGKTEYIWGALPARSALRAIGEDVLGPVDSPKWKIARGILEHPQLGMRAAQYMLRNEWNLQAHQAEALIFRDAAGKPIPKESRESAVVHALVDNFEGNPKWIDRATVTMPDTDPYRSKPRWTKGEKIKVQEHHRRAARLWSEAMEDLADRQGLGEEMRKEFYAPHTGPSKFLGRILDLEPATAKDRANIHKVAKRNLNEGEYSADLLDGILPENLSRAKALQVRDSLLGKPIKTIKGLRGRIKSILMMADVEAVPKEINQPHFKERKGAPWVSDAVTAHEQYLRYSLRKIHLEPALEAILPVLETLGESKGFGTGLGPVSRRAYAEEWLKQNVGKPTGPEQRVDAWLEHLAMRYPVASNFPVIKHLFKGRAATRAAHAVNRYQYYRLLGFALDSALTNMTQGVNNLATYGLTRTLGSYGRLFLNPRNLKFALPLTKKTLRYKGKSFEFDPEQEFREFFTGPDPRVWVKKPFTSLERIVLAPFTLVEYINRGSSFLAALSEAQAKGLSFKEGMKLGQGEKSRFLEKHLPDDARKAFSTTEAEWHARQRVMETQFGYSVVESSPIFRTPARKVALQFFSYPSQQMALLFDGLRGKVEPGAYARIRFAALAGFTAFAGSYLADKLFGIDVDNLWSVRGVVPRSPGPNFMLGLWVWGALFGDWESQARLKREYGTPDSSPLDIPASGLWVPRGVRKATGITHRSLDDEPGVYRILPVRPVQDEESSTPRRRKTRPKRKKRPKR